ncbi:MAG: PH domain-containing protein [Actinomycetota bacterium]
MRRPPSDAEATLASSVAKYLLDSERLVVAVRRHPAQLIEPVLSAVATLLAVGWLDARLPAVPFVRDVVWLAFFAVAGRAVWRLAEWRKDWFLATDRRLLLAYGVVTRKVAMMPLSKVTDLSYNRTPMGRLLGYGEFVLESAGQDQAMHRVPWLPSPDSLYRLICAEIFDPDLGRWRPRDRPRRRLVDTGPGAREQVTEPVEGWPPAD